MYYGFVTYFDILGFKNIVESKSEEEIINILDSFKTLNVDSYNGAEDLMTSYECEYKYTYFSDCIVRSLIFNRDIDIDDKLFLLNMELFEISRIQYSLLVEKGVLIRGGLTFNQLHHCKDYVFGKGMNEAYYIESMYSKYPRICISNDLIQEIIDYNISGKYFPGEWNISGVELSKQLRKDMDGLYHIDYMQNLLENIEATVYRFEEIIENHKISIIEYYNSTNSLDIALKNNWIINYHNLFIKRNEKRIISEISPRLEMFKIERIVSPWYKDIDNFE